MDAQTVFSRLSQQFREMRSSRGLTQAQLAVKARIPRLKVIQIEKGLPSVAAGIAVACALDAELTLIPARLPTVEEARRLFADD